MDTKNVTYGKPGVGGAIYTAPLWAPLPNNATSDLDIAFVSLGYISEEGLVNANSPESESIKAWGGDTVLVTQTGKEDTFTYTLIESTNIDVLREIYGEDNVSGSLESGIEIRANAKGHEEHALVAEMILKGGLIKRIVIPRGKITEVGEITYSDSDAVGFATTIMAMPDEDGNTHYEYIVASDTAEIKLVTFTATQFGGTTGSTNSTAINFTFSSAVTGLLASHITLASGTGSAIKGTLTGSGTAWSLAITDPVEGTVLITIDAFNGYRFPETPVTVTVFSAD